MLAIIMSPSGLVYHDPILVKLAIFLNCTEKEGRSPEKQGLNVKIL